MKRSIVISISVTTALFFGGIGSAKADPPVVHESTDTTPAVKGVSKTGRGVEGWSDANFGVVGISKTSVGVDGISESSFGVVGQSKTSAGVKGFSDDGRGVEGWSTKSEGVVGITANPDAAAAEFTNTGGGDHLRAGAFRVINNGDVLVRGQKIGATGPQGPQGLQGLKGDPGIPGPAVRTVALCQSPELGNGTWPCSNRTVTRVNGACTVTSDTGSCSNSTAGGCCSVCVP